MISWFAKNGIAANFLMIGLLILGGYCALYQIPLEVRPNQEFNSINIRMPYRGASPEEVEERIVIPIERAIDGIQGIESVHSSASSERANIDVSVDEKTDIRELLEEIKGRVERISTFPSETETPDFSIPSTNSWWEVITVVVTGDIPSQELTSFAYQIQDEMTSLPNISQTNLLGEKDTEVSIEAKLDKLRDYGLTLSDLTNAIKRSSVDLSAGRININGQRIQLSTKGEARSVEDYENITLKAVNGAIISLGEVATISDSYEETKKITRINRKPAILIEVMRVGDENAIQIANRIKEYVAKRNADLPDGIKLYTWDDDSISLRGRLTTLGASLLQGAVLVLIMLGLFLRPALAFWVVIGIPVSFAGGLIFMPFFGITANVMSLFAFIIVIGIVVDDAIVTSENIYSKITDGQDPLQAAIIGTKEVATPVTFGIITTIVAFLPLSFAFEGFYGAYMKQIPPIVAGVLLFSLIESKLILPSHLKNLRPVNPRNLIFRLQNKIAQGLEWIIQKIYRPVLNFTLHYRYAVVSLFIALAMLMLGYWESGRLGYVTMPSIDRYKITATLRLSEDSGFADTDEQIKRIVSAAEQLKEEFRDSPDSKSGRPLVKQILSHSGSSRYGGGDAENQGRVSIEIVPPSEREFEGPRNEVLAKRWREIVGEIPNAERFNIYSERSSGHGSGSGNEAIEVQLRGPNSTEKTELALTIKEELKSIEGIASVWFDVGRPLETIEITLRPRAQELGVNQQTLARQVRAAFYGEEAQRVQRERNTVRVMVRLPEEDRNSLNTLNNLKIDTGRGEAIPFHTVATATFVEKPSRISRIDGAQVLNLYAQSEDKETNILKIAEDLSPYLDDLLAEYPDLTWRYEGAVAELMENQHKMLFIWIALGFTLYALLAIPFRSLLQPIFVLLAVPFGIIGAIFGHLILDITPSLLSTFGMLAMAGVVVNDSLVMVDYINRNRRAKAKEVKESDGDEGLLTAVLNAGAARFRPIMLTSLTTFVGLLPLIHDNSIQAQFLIPMAVSLAYGILFATFITLLLIPSAYLITEDVIKQSRRFLKWYKAPFIKEEQA